MTSLLTTLEDNSKYAQPITINGQKIEASKTIGSRNNDNNDDGIEDQTDLQLKIPDASSLAGKDIVAYSEIARSDKPDHYTSVHQDTNDNNVISLLKKLVMNY